MHYTQRNKVYFYHLLFLIIALLNACSYQPPKEVKDGPPNFNVDVSKISDATPRYEPKSRYGNPDFYDVNGQRYFTLKKSTGYHQRGIASWYGTKFNGQLTSSREPYDMLAMTGANRVLPIPSYVRVTNLENGKHIIVKINDRGPFVANRIIDLSYAAAKKLGYLHKGTALVQITAIDIQHPNTKEETPVLNHPKLYLQLGAFSEIKNAKRLMAKVRELISRPVQIHTSQYHDRPIYRVQLGPLNNVKESDKLFQTLQENGFRDTITVIG